MGFAGPTGGSGGGVQELEFVEGFGAGVGYAGGAGDLPGANDMSVAVLLYSRGGWPLSGITQQFWWGNQEADFDGWVIETNSTPTMRFGTNNGTVASPTIGVIPPRALAPMLVVGVRSSGGPTIVQYINGSLVASAAVTGAITPSANTPTVGYHTTAGRPAIGGVGGMAYTEAVLTLEQVLVFTEAVLLAGDIVDPGGIWQHYWRGADAAAAPATWTSLGTVGGMTLNRQGAPTAASRRAKWY